VNVGMQVDGVDVGRKRREPIFTETKQLRAAVRRLPVRGGAS
jgi:hypothetical protein